MKKGFTMIELIFVIVILGILAAVAIPKLAATRDDAKAASIKTDIGTATQAVPAWFQGQKEAAFQNAMTIDTSVWKQSGSTCEYVYTDSAGDTVKMRITKEGNSTALPTCPEDNATVYGSSPEIQIILSASNGGDIVDTLVNSMKMSDMNITLAGKKVKW